jgi:hypothetical protein
MSFSFRPNNNEAKSFTTKLTEILDGSYKSHKDREPRRDYLGASMMGGECLRSVAYQYHGVPKDSDRGFTGKTYRIFDMGHDGESRMAEYLAIAGFDLRVADPQGVQFGYVTAGGRMRGHIDGVILSGPDVGLPFPALWENKALGATSFNKTAKDGISLAKPLYYVQVQIYMAYMQLENCLFTCINRDTGLIYAEVIPLSITRAQEFSDRGVRVVKSQSPEEFNRIARDCTDFRCKLCDHFRTCWGLGEVEAAPVASNDDGAPNWLRG